MDTPPFTLLFNKLPSSVVETIYYYSLPQYQYLGELKRDFQFAADCKLEIDTIYQQEHVYVFPEPNVSKVVLMYLNNMLLNDLGRGHQILGDDDTNYQFILFYDY